MKKLLHSCFIMCLAFTYHLNAIPDKPLKAADVSAPQQNHKSKKQRLSREAALELLTAQGRSLFKSAGSAILAYGGLGLCVAVPQTRFKVPLAKYPAYILVGFSSLKYGKKTIDEYLLFDRILQEIFPTIPLNQRFRRFCALIVYLTYPAIFES